MILKTGKHFLTEVFCFALFLLTLSSPILSAKTAKLPIVSTLHTTLTQPTKPDLSEPLNFQHLRIRDGFLMNPHKPASRGPWFEGWYTRITDSAGKRSMSVITATFLRAGATYSPGSTIPGYIAILISEGDGAPTQVYEAFPEKTMSYVNNATTSINNALNSTADFCWFAEGYGMITNKLINIEIPGKTTFRAEFSGGKAWGKNVLSGPEGVGGLMTKLPLHWHVHSLASETIYEITLNGQKFSGTGTAHQEKNWGKVFPSAWIWLQGISSDGEAQLAATGGKLNLGIAEP
ncbi:MAG TPA: tocopherol cyclase family protein, partial [Elusimicrobiales bacterium]|nr:tocopherol cyclase family protein [Elusimicrobiales bacterium]